MGGPASDFVSVCLLLGTTLSGRLLGEQGEAEIGADPLISLARLREIIAREDPPDGTLAAELCNVTSRGPIIWRVIIQDDEMREKETIFLVNARTGEVIAAYDSIQSYHIW